MGLLILVAAFTLIAVVWYFTRQFQKNTAYGSRVFSIGLILAFSGVIVRQSDDSLLVIAGALLSYIGISFILIGIIVLIRAYLIGEFK